MLQNFYVAFNETSAQILSLTAFVNSKSLKINLLFFLQDKMLQQQEIHKQFPIFLQLFQSPYQILGVGIPSSTMLFHPIIKQLKKLIKKKTIGKPLTVYHHFGHYLPNWHPWEDYRNFYVSKKETGAAREVVPFELVWMIHLFSDVYSVYGDIDKISTLEANIDDIYQILIEFANGIKCTFIVDVISEPAINATRITGDKGMIYCDHNTGTIKIGKGNKWKEVKIETGKIAKGYKGNTPSDSIYVEEMKSFLDTIKKSSARHTFDDELKILRVLDAIELSNKKSKKIII